MECTSTIQARVKGSIRESFGQPRPLSRPKISQTPVSPPVPTLPNLHQPKDIGCVLLPPERPLEFCPYHLCSEDRPRATSRAARSVYGFFEETRCPFGRDRE